MEYLEKENIDGINVELINYRFEKFELKHKLFEPIRIKYCDYIINVLKNKIINEVCYDIKSSDKYGWCCEHDYKPPPSHDFFSIYDEKKACIYYRNTSKTIDDSYLTNKCCLHKKKKKKNKK